MFQRTGNCKTSTSEEYKSSMSPEELQYMLQEGDILIAKKWRHPVGKSLYCILKGTDGDLMAFAGWHQAFQADKPYRLAARISASICTL